MIKRINVAVEDGVPIALGLTVLVVVDRFTLILLCELCSEGDACRKAEQVRIDVLPPLMWGAATGCNGSVDGKGRTADKRAYPEQSAEEHRHVIAPAASKGCSEIATSETELLHSFYCFNDC